ncbi:2767_t:CDS:2, partial [Paraglomus brasilianum]
ALGAKVIATGGSDEKLAIAAKYGADYVVNYKQNDWVNKIIKITSGHGVDVVYDPIGMIQESMKCIAWSGRLIVIGFAAGTIEKVAMNRVLLKNCSILGLYWGAYARYEKEAIPR